MLSKDYLITTLNRFNKFENISEQWDFVKEAIEEEQANIIMAWLGGLLDSDTAKARLNAFKWLMDFIVKVQVRGKTALVKLKETA